MRATAPQPLQVYKYVQYLYTGTPGWQACIPVHQAVAACCCLLAAARAADAAVLLLLAVAYLYSDMQAGAAHIRIQRCTCALSAQ